MSAIKLAKRRDPTKLPVPALKDLLTRNGASHHSKDALAATQAAVQARASVVMSLAVMHALHAKREVVTAADVRAALAHLGIKVYSC